MASNTVVIELRWERLFIVLCLLGLSGVAARLCVRARRGD
jgi:hypothetical protein